ncbi:MAG: OmpA family protein [Magnetococcus sp. DMHC-6]
MAVLLCLFALMLSFAKVDMGKFHEAIFSIKGALGLPQDPLIKPTQATVTGAEFKQEVALVHMKEKMDAVLAKLANKKDGMVLEQEEGFIIRFKADALFIKGTILMTASIESILQGVAAELKEIPNLVQVSAYTDNTLTNPNGPYPNNWILSAAQAAMVVEFLMGRGGMAPTRLQSKGMGAYYPLVSNESEEGRAQNRRIEILILRMMHSQPQEQSKDKTSQKSDAIATEQVLKIEKK